MPSTIWVIDIGHPFGLPLKIFPVGRKFLISPFLAFIIKKIRHSLSQNSLCFKNQGYDQGPINLIVARPVLI